MKYYLNHSSCISPQSSFEGKFPYEPFTNQTTHHILASEPDYKPFFPMNLLRRMGKISRMGLTTGLKVIEDSKTDFDAIISGSAYGSNEESFKFLDQIYKYDEGPMTPTNFTQSTTNVVSSQLGLMTKNYCYNSTNSQKAHSFENSLLEGMILLDNQQASHILVGAVDEISEYTFNLFGLLNWVRKDQVTPQEALNNPGTGFVPGEGSAFFHLSTQPESECSVEVAYLKTFAGIDQENVLKEIRQLEEPDLILTPRNGDLENDKAVNHLIAPFEDIPQIDFKQFFGDSPTVSAPATWLAQQLLNPAITGFQGIQWERPLTSILVFNKFATGQSSLLLLKK